MKVRVQAITALLGAALLVACSSQGDPGPTPTAGSAGQATATIGAAAPTDTVSTDAATPTQGTTGAQAATAPDTTPTEAAQAQPTSTQAAAGPIELQPTTLETNDITRQGALAQERQMNLPAGFHINVFAAGINSARWLGYAPDGTLYATSTAGGKVLMLPDKNGDGVADSVKVFADGLPGVQGIGFKDGAVYVATQSSIFKLQDTNGDGVADTRAEIANDLPTGGGHSTRTLAFSPDGSKLFVSAGSSCNVCKETDPKRAAISLYSPDGKFQEVFAKGLRNAVGIVFQPGTGDLYATNNGRDELGDDLPPETIYKVTEGSDYGWPYCYGQRIPDKSQNPPAGYCEKTGVPAVEMQAHSAPLGLAFYNGKQFPQQYSGSLFVAFHGSWNRSVPTGYKLVLVHFKDNKPDTSLGAKMVEDFATGWSSNGSVWGRPVDPIVAPDGSLMLTDDKADAIYRISYAENAGP
jgi:glucose/arabinose dehydrogenase